MSSANTLLHVAIDFGTTFSGYAFRFKHQKDIQVCKNLGGGASVGFQSYKVPTCVLTDDNDEFVAFGYDAQTSHSGAADGSESDSDDEETPNKTIKGPVDVEPKNTFCTPYHFYDEFKMKLAGEKKFNENMKLEAYDGHTCSAMTIFAMVLTFLKKHLLGVIRQSTETLPKSEEIKWVLTVPAIWSDSAKQFMRKCAVKSGIVTKDTEEQLLIALEPEAASLFCRTLDCTGFVMRENIQNVGINGGHEQGLPPNSQYMVVDCGGGTVDVTAHHYKKKNDICELYSASGGGWGGRNVNMHFEKKMDEVLGAGIMETFRKTNQVEYLQAKVKFEKEKRSIFEKEKNTGEMKVAKYSFSLGYEFVKICIENSDHKKIEAIVESDQDSHKVSFTNGFLRFPEDVLHSIFAPSINDIKNHILDLTRMTELKDLQYIYLVGGYSDCSLLQHVIQAEFKNGTHKGKNIQVILAPYEASLAVMKGAVLFGENPQAISSRRSRRNYCVAKSASNAAKYGLGKVKRELGKIIVKQNEEIYNDDVRDAHFSPYSEGKVFKLYHYKVDSLTQAAKFSTDTGVDEIKIDCSDIVDSHCTADTKISVYLYFDSTEIHVTARNDKSPNSKPVKVSIDCLSH